MSLSTELVTAATAAGRLLTTAESCTGGLVAAAITDVPGSSACFAYGIVTYSNAAKMDLLDVPLALLDAHGAVSEEVVEAMAQGARIRAGADIAVAISGIAGPGGSEFKPEGRVCFGLATAGHVTTETIEFGALGRDSVRIAARDHALRLLIAACNAQIADS